MSANPQSERASLQQLKDLPRKPRSIRESGPGHLKGIEMKTTQRGFFTEEQWEAFLKSDKQDRDFLNQVVKRWEEAADEIESLKHGKATLHGHIKRLEDQLRQQKAVLIDVQRYGNKRISELEAELKIADEANYKHSEVNRELEAKLAEEMKAHMQTCMGLHEAQEQVAKLREWLERIAESEDGPEGRWIARAALQKDEGE